MTSPSTFASYGTDLETLLLLRTHPIAIKMLKSEDEIPAGAIRPKRDRGEHWAVCQAFSLARRQGQTLAMFLEDHWCYAPIIGYGLVEPPASYLDGFTHSFFIADQEAARRHAHQVPRIPVGQYPGMVMGPLPTANFEPDLVMIYCNPAQLRHLLLSLRYLHGTEVTSTFDPIGSCIHSVVPSLQTGDCAVTIPDPGDFERAGAADDEMVLTVPASRLEELMTGVRHFEERGMGFRFFSIAMHPNYKQPPFYEEYFREWGLDGPVTDLPGR
jgi:uncharacterized protein (DUF169 family)